MFSYMNPLDNNSWIDYSSILSSSMVNTLMDLQRWEKLLQTGIVIDSRTLFKLARVKLYVEAELIEISSM